MRVRDQWRNARRTFHAPDSYYTLVEQVIAREIASQLDGRQTVLDVGCGNGRYTLQIAERARQVIAYDLSPHLIAEARSTAAAVGASNVSFLVGDAEADRSTGTHDLVICMGVLVCITDDVAFHDLLERLADAVAPGGMLVLRETVSGRGRVTWNGPTHSACYRALHAYRSPLARRGLVLEKDIHLATWSRWQKRTNHLLVFRRAQLAPFRPSDGVAP